MQLCYNDVTRALFNATQIHALLNSRRNSGHKTNSAANSCAVCMAPARQQMGGKRNETHPW